MAAWSVYPFHCISFLGVFRCRDGCFSSFSVAYSGDRSRPNSCVSVRSCSFRSPFSCVAFELIKTARVDNPSVVCPISSISSISIASSFSPFFDTGGGAFSLLTVLRPVLSVRLVSSLPLIGLRCLIVSSVSLLLLSGRLVLPARCPRGSRACFASSSYRSSSHRLIVLRPVLPIRLAGSVERSVFAKEDGAIMSAWRGIIPPRSRRGVSCCLLRRRVLLSPHPSRFSCRFAARFASFRYSPRLATRGAGRCCIAVVLGRLRRLRRCLPCVGHGVVSAWRVIISGCFWRGGGCAVWIMWLGRLFAVLVVYLYCQLVVYIV